ncbi:hypothetical protein AB6A40_000246 [Gnathostoma spinigerum]|uniref:G-protein coupled receptors family 3 profile domain-containing protein n=1 Tax=Gnathostoma spinigerum TaxID=75299 RepID=A0ABD6EAN7_9BILA
MFRIHSPNVTWFDEYYFSLNPETNTQNPWFREFWQDKFRCQFTVSKDDDETRMCTGKENLTLNYKQDAKLSQVANSIYVIAMALQTMFYDKCKDNTTLCPEMLAINGTLLYQYLLNVTFTDRYQQEIYFDRKGDPPAWYDILNYVGETEGFRTVGYFKQKRRRTYKLHIDDTLMFFDRSPNIPESVCSKPCGVGERPRETVACCWICESCLQHQIVNYTTNQCQNCSLGYWPDDNRLSCHELPHEALSWSASGTVLALILASLGIVTTLLTTLVFIQHNHTPVVKSTTRELSYIILSGLLICYTTTFIILARPSFTSCFLTRTVPPIAFSIVYSALLTKTNRIARILAGSKKRILTKKPRFLSTSSQVVITWILVGVECVFVTIGVIDEMPQAGFDSYFQPYRMVLICSSTTFAFMTPFVWNGFLISLCTLYAVKTRNLPENFNEAKFIGFTMYCTLVVWTAFIVLHLGTSNKALVMSFSFSLSASVALILLFFPKLYIILLHPEKNVRSNYMTTKLIRCHFGNSEGVEPNKQTVSSIKTKTSQFSVSSNPTRSLSVRTSQSFSHDASTQTESSSIFDFARTYSVIGRKRSKQIDEDVLQLIDSCRRYQEQKARGSITNYLFDERPEDEVNALLADSINSSFRAVLGTVARTGAPDSSTGNDDVFEQLLRSRGVQPLSLSCATPL